MNEEEWEKHRAEKRKVDNSLWIMKRKLYILERNQRIQRRLLSYSTASYRERLREAKIHIKARKKMKPYW